MRSKRNPVFLHRLLRPRKPIKHAIPEFLSIKLSGFVPQCQGLLIVWLISLSTAIVDQISETVISVVSQKEIPLKDGEYTDRSILLSTSCASEDLESAGFR